MGDGGKQRSVVSGQWSKGGRTGARNCAGNLVRSDSIRPNPAWEQSTDGTDYTDCTSGVIEFHPARSISLPGCRAQVLLPETVLPALQQMCKTNPNDGRGQNLKTTFFHRNMNISIRHGGCGEVVFYETNPNKEKCELASTDCKSVTCMKTLWWWLTVPGAKRTQMKPWKELDQSKEPRRRGCPLNTRKTRKRGSTGVGETATESYPQNAREEEAVCMRATVVVGRERRARRIVVSAGPAVRPYLAAIDCHPRFALRSDAATMLSRPASVVAAAARCDNIRDTKGML